MFELALDFPRKNALSTATMDAIAARIERAGGEPLLLVGAPDAFSAGLDLKEVASLDDAGMRVFLARLESLMRALFLYPGPTVAAVTGHAIAGGCILALCCDHRAATLEPRARIGLNEVALGLTFPPTVFRICRQRIAPQHLERVLLGAQLFTTAEAERYSLVDEVVADPVAKGRTRLQELAAHPPLAYASTKRRLREASVAVGEAETRAFETEALAAWTAPELKARLAAALAKR